MDKAYKQINKIKSKMIALRLQAIKSGYLELVEDIKKIEELL